MNSSEWLEVIKKSSDFPKGMEKLIIKYGQMLLSENGITEDVNGLFKKGRMVLCNVNGRPGLTTSTIPHSNGMFPVWFKESNTPTFFEEKDVKFIR